MGFFDSLGGIGGFAPVIGGISSVVGLIQDGQARQRAQQQAQQALQQFGAANDADYQAMLGNNSRTLMGAAGAGGTALTSMGSNLGSANAAAGITNSSAVGGSLALGQQATDSSLAGLAAQNQYNAAHLHALGQQQLAQMQLGQSNVNYGNANADLQGSRAGFGQFLGALGQSNLLGGQQQPDGYGGDYSYAQGQIGSVPEGDMYTKQAQSLQPVGGGQGMYGPSGMGANTQFNLSALGANSYRPALPQINGTQNQGVNLGGNAGGLGNGGQGQGGSNPFYQPPQSKSRNWYDINSPLGGR